MIITSEEYKGKEPEEKIAYLNDLWATYNNYLFGKINKVEDDRFYVTPYDLNHNYIFHPYTGKRVIRVNGNCTANGVTAADVNEDIMFKFIIQKNEDTEDRLPITVELGSVIFIKDFGAKNIIVDDKKEFFSLISLTDAANVKTVNDKKYIFFTEIEELYNKRINALNHEVDHSEEDFKNKLQEIAESEKKIEESNLLIESLKAEFDRRSIELNELKRMIGVYELIQGKSAFQYIAQGQVPPEDRNEQIAYIQNYIYKNNGIYFDTDVVKYFYAALKTSQMPVLAGSPGTGKTSLIRTFSEAIGAKLTIIPVQPSWTDKTDLLGYYNPVKCFYMPTEFMEALVEAERENKGSSNGRKRMHIICLDEMNLAQVEYYFAEFLSVMQEPKEKRKLRLYSDEVLRSLGYSEGWAGIPSGDKTIYKDWIDRYPPVFRIPDNVRFVGTVNKDETTKDLSPKVVDRCFFIKLEDSGRKMEYNPGQWDGNNLLLTPDDMHISEMPNDKAFEEFKKQFTDDARKEPHDNKASYFVNISQRAGQLFEQLSASGVFKDNEEVKEALLASYIFPKINWPLDEGDYKNLKSKLESITDKCRGSYAKDIYNWMKARSSDGILTYWR